MPRPNMRLLWLIGHVVAQDLFEKENTFLAQHGLTMQTATPNETSLTAQLAIAGFESWYKTITPTENTNLCIDLPGQNVVNGNKLWLWECNGQDAQIWVFDNFQIRYGANENFCIDAGDMGNGVQLWLWECNGLGQQSWGYDFDELKVYISNSATCLDSYEGVTDNGQALHIWDCNGLSNQQWSLWDSDAPSPGPSPPSPPSPGPPDDVPSNVFMPDCNLAAPGWPTFNTPDELQADGEWSKYFNTVYGEIPSIGYPICVGAFTQIPKSGGQTQSAKNCKDTTVADGTLVHGMAPCCDPPENLVTYIYNSRNVKHAVPDNMWAEIQHITRNGDRGAAWYYLSFGSAIWFNVGTTISFNDHPDASEHFLSAQCREHHKSTPHTECEQDFDDWFKEATKQMYTSIQFTAHYDCGCGEQGPSSWDKHDRLCQTEIIDLNGHGTKRGCASDTYKAGWAAQQDCNCDNSKDYSNCQGFGL